jgi:hypothetical protein
VLQHRHQAMPPVKNIAVYLIHHRLPFMLLPAFYMTAYLQHGRLLGPPACSPGVICPLIVIIVVVHRLSPQNFFFAL